MSQTSKWLEIGVGTQWLEIGAGTQRPEIGAGCAWRLEPEHRLQARAGCKVLETHMRYLELVRLGEKRPADCPF